MSTPKQKSIVTENDIETEEEEILIASENFLFIATWADRLAWLILSLALLMFFLRIIQDFSQPFSNFSGQIPWLARLSAWLGYFYSLFIGVTYFALLKGLSAGAHFLISHNQD